MKKLEFSDDLLDILIKIDDDIANAMLDSEGVSIDKGNAEFVDVSDVHYSFDVLIDNNKTKIKVGTWIRNSFPNMFSNNQILRFVKKYNDLKSSNNSNNNLVKIELPEFKFNPNDIRSTFLSLVSETYPHGFEEEVLPLISPIGLQKDEFGNYYKIIGSSDTMFTSHLDTVDRKKSKVNLYSEKVGTDEIIRTDGTTILGADDKAGVTVMLYMMFNNVPGVYYFFIGEERGGVGSSDVSRNFDKIEHLQNIKRCVSFDRRNYHSIITSQYVVCCSDEFGEALSKEFSKSNLKMELDPTGIFTDSANFVDNIQECTNISVGYFDEHTTKEHQNITFLEKLAKACVKVNWEELPTVRKVGLDDDIRSQYYEFLEEFNETVFNCSFRIVNEFSITYIKFEIDEVDFDLVKYDIISLSSLFEKHDIDLDIYFEYDSIMIELLDKRHFKYLESFNSFVYESDSDDYNDDYLEFPEGSINELKYWLERMYSDNNLSSFVEANEDEISVYLFLDKVEKISTLFKVFEITDNISKYSLEDYSVEVELYENKEGYPVFKFDFKKN